MAPDAIEVRETVPRRCVISIVASQLLWIRSSAESHHTGPRRIPRSIGLWY